METTYRRNRRTHGGRKRRDKDWQQLLHRRRGGRCDRTGTLDDKTPGGQTQDGGQLEERMREKKTRLGGRKQGDKLTAYLHADDSVYEE